MLKHTVIGETSFESALGSASILAPSAEKHKRGIVADLLLTALIDAFSILVIFLLMSFSNSGELLTLGKDMQLPEAARGEPLEPNPVVKVEDGQLFLEEKLISGDQLVERLLQLRKDYQERHPGQEFPGTLTIQADRRLKYELMSSVVQASSHAGYSDLKFAVLMK